MVRERERERERKRERPTDIERDGMCVEWEPDQALE
jgi:hypothetical protein